MPLSEHEQRLLDQIERALYADDPKFASTYRSTDLRKHYSRRILRCAVLFVVGVILLMVGVISKTIPLGVGGFVVMLVSLVFGVTSWQRLTGNREGGQPRPPGKAGRTSSVFSPRSAPRPTPKAEGRAAGPSPGPTRGRGSGKVSWKGRLEERWRRRWEERGGR